MLQKTKPAKPAKPPQPSTSTSSGAAVGAAAGLAAAAGTGSTAAARPPGAQAKPTAPSAAQPKAAQPSAAARQPQARKPGQAPPRANVPPPPKPDDEPEPQPGDLICGQCGAGNGPTRKFCRRCGNSLEQAVVAAAVKVPWYRRIFGGKAKSKNVAGARPQRLKSESQRKAARVRRVITTVLVLALVLAGGWYALSRGGAFVESIKDRTSEKVPRAASDVKASSSASKHGSGKAVDGFTNTSWQAEDEGKAGDSLTFSFDEPFRVVQLLMFPGASSEDADFLKEARPQQVTVVATTEGGDQTSKTWNLADKPGQQTFDLGISDVSKVKLTVDSAYGLKDDTRVAVAEVKFYTR